MTPVLGQCKICRAVVLENEAWKITDEHGLIHSRCEATTWVQTADPLKDIQEAAKRIFEKPQLNGYWRPKKKKKQKKKAR